MDNNDHDLLIRIDTRMDGIERQLTDLRSGVLHDIAELTVRVRVIEDRALEYPVGLATERYDKVAKEWNDFKVRLGVWVSVVAIAGALLGNIIRLFVLPKIGIR